MPLLRHALRASFARFGFLPSQSEHRRRASCRAQQFIQRFPCRRAPGERSCDRGSV